RAAILAGGRKRIQAVIVGAGGEQGQSLDLVRVRGGVDKRVVGPVRGPGQADRPLAGQAVDRGGNVSGRVPGGVIAGGARPLRGASCPAQINRQRREPRLL